LLLVIGIGYLIQRWLEPKAVKEQFEGMVRSAQEWQISAPVTARWQLTNSAAARHAACTAGLQTDIPCWLARQIAGQSLPPGCASCEVRAAINAQIETR
jgi:hypothetical protein